MGITEPPVDSDGQEQAAVPEGPHVPQVEVPTTRDEIAELAATLAQYRAEVAAFRDEMAKQQAPRVSVVATAETEEQRLADRLAEIAKHDFYCVGCGRLYNYLQKCVGSRTAPHPAIEVMSTDELKGDPSGHSAAPPSTVETLQAAATA